MPKKSGVGVRFDMIFAGKNEEILLGKIIRIIGSIGKKYRMKDTVDRAVFPRRKAKSMAKSM